MGAKERVTLYVTTDASGRKLPLAMIGHSKGPRCFRLRKPPLKYFSQTNAWSDSRVFGLCWKEVLLPWVRSVTNKPVLLIMDNDSSHANLVDPREQVTVVELPSNCTAKHEPADAGIIAALKALQDLVAPHPRGHDELGSSAPSGSEKTQGGLGRPGAGGGAFTSPAGRR